MAARQATDISPTILRYAKAAAEQAGLATVETRELDGECHHLLPAGSFDAAISRVGPIYFPDQRNARRAAGLVLAGAG